jgi:Tol biopolymer transport system component
LKWLPGGTKLLVSGQGGPGVFGTWSLATAGGEIRKLQDATITALSPDGSRIAFVKQKKVWQMSLGGEEPALLFSVPGGAYIWGLAWSPDGRWLTYLHSREGQRDGAVLEAHPAGEGAATKVFEDAALRGFCWLPANHVVLDRWEILDQPFSNLWEVDVDLKDMKAHGNPRRLTNWAGFAIGSMSASADGKRLAVTKRLDQSDVFKGELSDQDGRLDHLSAITSDERVDWPGGWSRDNQWLLFQSDRTGFMSIFRQRLDEPNPEPLVANRDDNRAPVLSPDGKWVLYFAWPRSSIKAKTGRLMRMPVEGGSSEQILEVRGLPGSPQTSNYIIVPTTTGQPAFRCPSAPGASRGSDCVLSEAGGNEVVFYSFAPLPGASKSEIFRIRAKAPDQVSWDLTPDGSRIAYFEHDFLTASIHIRELASGATRDITVPGFVELVSLGWAANGKSLFVTNFAPAGSSLLHVTPDGKVRLLYKGSKEVEMPKASPDGRSLAFGEVISASNAWLIEGLPQ